ncbi:TonB-dependent receptor [Vibrio taketomensis]|uniref:TonB-dependent receptor n=1 Tax=Vibrio taketomensis TaxID=2572923 RepID=UPI0013895AAF|nr:TonB-dependent receptor [Vibrio taketomensis]
MKFSPLLFATSCLIASTASADSFTLPIWKEEAEARGYQLPKPFGLNLSYMSMEQGINVDSIALSNINIPGLDLDMKAEPGKQVTDVFTLRADVWLFPFLNIYGLVGKLEGYSSTAVNVDAQVKLHPLLPPLKIKHRIEDFRLDLDGDLKGAGFVLAGGYKQWFALVDANYTQTSLTVIDGSIDSYVVSPRLGYDFTKNGTPLRVWVGAMYQNVEQELSGELRDLNIPLDGRFDVKQRLVSEWNTLAGFQYGINRSWNIVGEMGFGERESAFLSLERRF